MKLTLNHTLWLSLGVGCALATMPIIGTVSAQEDAKEKASMPQPGDPAASKAGKEG